MKTPVKQKTMTLAQLTKVLQRNEIVLPKYKYITKLGKDDSFMKELDHALGHTYCCHGTGWGRPDPGELKDHEKSLLDSIDLLAAVQIKLKYTSVGKMRSGWEMHWINQSNLRLERFKYITEQVFHKVDKLLRDVDIKSYAMENQESIIKGFEISIKDIENEDLTEDQVLEKLSKKKLTVKESKKLLEKIKEDNADKLCQFSGSGNDPDVAKRICSRTGDPKKRGDCGSCRVAAEWEEAYG